MPLPEYFLKDVIRLLYRGDSGFYYVSESYLFSRLIESMNEKMSEIITSGNQNLLEMIDASNKTRTNIGGDPADINREFRSFIKNAAETHSKIGNLPFSIKIIETSQEVLLSPIDATFLLFLAGKRTQHISGSIRSGFGKNVEGIYLPIVFESMGVQETTKVMLSTIESSSTSLITLNKGLYYVMNARFLVDNNRIKIHNSGKEVDAMVFLYDENSLTYLLAIEFSLGGPGNPTAQRNKANDMHVKFGGYVGLLYTAFNLGVDMRRRIETEIATIFFNDDTEALPALKIYDLLEKQLRKRGYNPKDYLPSQENVEERFKEIIENYLA